MKDKKPKTIVYTAKLQSILDIKIALEESIKRDEYLMKKHNSTKVGQDIPFDEETIYNRFLLKLEQLIKLKEVIRDGNARLQADGKSNDYSIYLLSNLNRVKAFLNALNTFSGERPSLKEPSKKIEYRAIIDFKKVFLFQFP